ncbi:hypothetical protein [Hymenobacter sp. CRA2]|uniref:hypothetical protein n=1 Tax=Hymenobacter sp. CRA2 TaxID=1955620 RepID=UPI00098EE266|nr:hypothetical protein [Hymenobacter sp. CRA2]OON70568.1 hypothetical protein B0919_00655 [Hymenobacter sp. CRA2]
MSTVLPEFLDLSFRDDLGLLFGRWLRGTDDAEVRQGYEAALSVAVTRQARYWLLDMRRRGPASNTAMRWVIDAFLPRLVGCLHARIYLAYLLSPSHLSAMTPPAYAPATPLAHCDIRMFSDEFSALQWLTACHQQENAATVVSSHRS